MVPPFFGQDLLFVRGHGVERFDNASSLDASRDPNLLLVVLKVSLLCALTFKVEVEPFEELTCHHQQVGQMTVIKRSVYDDGYLVVSQINVSLELIHLLKGSLDVVD